MGPSFIDQEQIEVKLRSAITSTTYSLRNELASQVEYSGQLERDKIDLEAKLEAKEGALRALQTELQKERESKAEIQQKLDSEAERYKILLEGLERKKALSVLVPRDGKENLVDGVIANALKDLQDELNLQRAAVQALQKEKDDLLKSSDRKAKVNEAATHSKKGFWQGFKSLISREESR